MLALRRYIFVLAGLQLVLESKKNETSELNEKVTTLNERVAGVQEDCKGYLSKPGVSLEQEFMHTLPQSAFEVFVTYGHI